MKDELAAAAAKSAPPIVVSGAPALLDLTLNEWVAIATLAYIFLQAFFLIRSEMRKRRRK